MLGAGSPLISHEKDLGPNQISLKHIVAGQETVLHSYTCADLMLIVHGIVKVPIIKMQ